MKQLIADHITNAEKLESLYRQNKQDFANYFAEVAGYQDSDLIRFWKIRLASDKEPETNSIRFADLAAIIVISLITGMLVKLPHIFDQINEEWFYMRNLAILVFNGLIVYTFWQNRFSDWKKLSVYGFVVAVLLTFVNLLPSPEGHSVIIAFIHVPLLLWCMFGLAWLSFDYKNVDKKISFIRFNGELLIMTGLILLAGGLLSGVTIGLFSVIGKDIAEFYGENIAIFGAVAAPVLSFYLINLYPNLTSKIAPVIARVFTPLVLITLVIYLVSLVFLESKILEDRDLLILFNVMLIAVMAIIVFSISELNKSKFSKANVLILFILAVVTIIINTIALIAIITRVVEGLTPNRTVVLVTNVLIFANLILITKDLFKTCRQPDHLHTVEKTVARYLTVYFAWTLVAIFILPFVFGFE